MTARKNDIDSGVSIRWSRSLNPHDDTIFSCIDRGWELGGEISLSIETSALSGITVLALVAFF